MLRINTDTFKIRDAVLCMLPESESASLRVGRTDLLAGGFVNEHIMRRTNKLCSLQAILTMDSLSP